MGFAEIWQEGEDSLAELSAKQLLVEVACLLTQPVRESENRNISEVKKHAAPRAMINFSLWEASESAGPVARDVKCRPDWAPVWCPLASFSARGPCQRREFLAFQGLACVTNWIRALKASARAGRKDREVLATHV